MIASINGWELTQQGSNTIVSTDGVKCGEFKSETEAKDFCLTNDPLTTEINWYEVCESVPIPVKRHEWCHRCSESTKLGDLTICKHGKDE